MGDIKREEGNMPHAVCMPCPAQGHINSMLQLAKLLHHTAGFHITFVHSNDNYARILDTSGPTSLAGSSHFCFESIPIDSPESDDSHDQTNPDVSGHDMDKICLAIRKYAAGPFRQLLQRLNNLSSSSTMSGISVPKVTCIVADTYANFPLDIAAELGIPVVSFCSSSACGFMGCFSYKHLIDTGVVPLKSESDLSNGYLDTPIDSIPGMKNMRLRDLPSFIRTTNPHDVLLNFCKDETQDASKANAIIFNTFDELEGPVLDGISSVIVPPVYAVGPLNLLCHQIPDDSLRTIGSNMWKADDNCLQWLDGRAMSSVVYLNFGSLAIMSRQQLIEFALGLANSGYDFLWVMRPEIVKGESMSLPDELLSKIRERGLVTSWCSQEEVLRHPSIGVFLTHCGWNSTIESISGGVPMICWPYFSDQQTNCRYLCNEWGIGVEIDGDVDKEKVEKVIRMVMGGEKGAEMRRMAMKWKERAVRAVKPNENSFLNLERVVKEVFLQSQKIARSL